jgi:putative toxin-antitoxin system antitoxin component (TIGR02293 family)
MKTPVGAAARAGLAVREPRSRYAVGARRSGARPLEPQSAPPLVDIDDTAVDHTALAHLADGLGVTPDTLAAIVGLAPRTASRRKQGGAFRAAEADRLLRVARVFDDAVRVFGQEAKAAAWLSTPHALLDDATPLSWLGTDAGATAVGAELIRIEHGDFA